jgi:hypothetical protein
MIRNENDVLSVRDTIQARMKELSNVQHFLSSEWTMDELDERDRKSKGEHSNRSEITLR